MGPVSAWFRQTAAVVVVFREGKRSVLDDGLSFLVLVSPFLYQIDQMLEFCLCPIDTS